MTHERLNAYRIMWLFVMFDLPVETKTQRKAATDFRKKLLKDGFSMLQFSIYIRHCPSLESGTVHIYRVEKNLPPDGKVSILTVTDKQFGLIKNFWGKTGKASKLRPAPQLELF